MKEIEEKTINTIRVLCADAIEKANSGHPGLPMGAATMAYSLWAKMMKHNPKNPNWINRDRFVLSAGHGSMLVYALLHLFGYGLTLEDLQHFRQLGSKTPGHPEHGHTVGVETTTGPLGQGFANAVGMAMAETYLANKFNTEDIKIMDHYTYAIVGDGCMMEGVTAESASLAGTLQLDKLIVLYDSNKISIEGDTDIAFREDVAERFRAYGWDVINVEDGNDLDGIYRALEEAKREAHKPTLIIVKTIIGYGASEKQGKASAHGEPLGEGQLKSAKRFFGFPEDSYFYVPTEVYKHTEHVQRLCSDYEDSWNTVYEDYKSQNPKLSEEFDAWMTNSYEINVDELMSGFSQPMATRQASGTVINKLSKMLPNLIGGSADLAPSTKTIMTDRGDFSPEDRSGSNLHFGVREFAMGAILNGMSLHGGLNVYGATFFVFSDYMKHAMRLSAIMGLPVVYVLTHDSIGVGEDGPTHQPIEQLAALRSMPEFISFRPADSKETAVGWYYALSNKKHPTGLVLTRQSLPVYNETSIDALKGAYILLDCKDKNPDLIFIASGSEVELIYEAGKELLSDGYKVRVVSMPSMELFELQSDAYKQQVLPIEVRKRIAVEALTSFGWYKYVGLDGEVIAIDHYGESGPGHLLFEKYGFTKEEALRKAKAILSKRADS